MKNKKGILLRNVLEMIVAVFCILLLVYGGGRLYGIFAQKTEIEQARATIDQIFGTIDSLEDGEKGDYLVTSPKEWYFVVYEENQNMLPQCEGKNCLCICPSDKDLEEVLLGWKTVNSLFYKQDKGIEKCEKEGFCKNIDKKVKIREAYFIDREDITNVVFVNWISFYDIPKELFFKNKAETLYISDLEIDSGILSNFLNKEVEFEGEKKKINLFVEDVFDKCSDEDIGGGSTWEPKSDETLQDFIKKESEDYLNELIEKEEIKGGKIIFIIFDKTWVSNLISVSEGEVNSCSVIEEKKICSKEINEDRSIGGYIRMYTCN